MLGRKQSMKGDEVLADYGAGETLTQLGISGDVEWVRHFLAKINYFIALNVVECLLIIRALWQVF